MKIRTSMVSIWGNVTVLSMRTKRAQMRTLAQVLSNLDSHSIKGNLCAEQLGDGSFLAHDKRARSDISRFGC